MQIACRQSFKKEKSRKIPTHVCIYVDHVKKEPTAEE